MSYFSENRKKEGKHKLSPIIIKAIILSVLIILLMGFLIPILLVALNSFKNEQDFVTKGPFGIPHFTFSVLVQAWKEVHFGNKLFNSFVISISVSFIAIVVSLLNAFAIGIGRVKGKAFFLVFFILAMTMPQEALAFPLYYFFKFIHMYDTKLSIIIVLSVLQTSFGTYLLASVFEAFPTALLESADLDGCGKLMKLIKIVLPLNLPSISVMFVFFFVWTWNEFFLPLILLVSNSNQTIPLAITMFQGEHSAVTTMQSATSFLGILPCIIFFFIFQRTFTRGLTAGGVKG